MHTTFSNDAKFLILEKSLSRIFKIIYRVLYYWCYKKNDIFKKAKTQNALLKTR